MKYKLSTYKGIVETELYPFQINLLDSLKTNKNNYIRKTRQLGISTIICIFALEYINETNNSIFIQTVSTEHRRELYDKIMNLYSNNRDKFKCSLDYNDYTKLTFSNNNVIYLMEPDLSNIPEGLYTNINYRIYDECSFYLNDIEIISLIEENRNKLCFIDNKDIFNFLEKYDNVIVSKLNYNVIPIRDDKWKQEQIKILGEEGFKKEYKV